jgi:hypothetical protein
VYPGRPNFESIAGGDEAESGFYLNLAQPICARSAYPDQEDASLVPRDSVVRVQLVLDSAGYARLQSHLQQSVEVRGTLFSSFTGHHHAPVLLQVLTPSVTR